MTKKSIFLSIIISISLVFGVFAILPRSVHSYTNNWVIKDGQSPLVIAHAGSNLLFPANTILAFEESVKLNVDVLEMDIRLTKDNILITHHDQTIDRLSNGTGNVRNYTYSELKTFDFAFNFTGINNESYIGHKKAIPENIEDLFIKFPSMLYIIEIKDEGSEGDLASDLLVKLIEQYDMQDSVIIASFHDDVIAKFREYSNETMMTTTTVSSTTKFVLLEKLRLGLFYKSPHAVIGVPISEQFKGIDIHMDTTHFIKESHRHNIAVHYWTINDKTEIQRLIELGADGIITDRPDIMFEVLNEMGF